MIEPGTHLRIHYPTQTHVRHFFDAPRELRSITVRNVRDLVRQPLTPDEFLQRPFVMRSRWLVKGYDNILHQWRQFYLGSSEEFAAPGSLRLALYEPSSTKPAELLGREFNPTVFDRKLMIRLIRRWHSRVEGELQLRVCCDDLRIIRSYE